MGFQATPPGDAVAGFGVLGLGGGLLGAAGGSVVDHQILWSRLRYARIRILRWIVRADKRLFKCILSYFEAQPVPKTKDFSFCTPCGSQRVVVEIVHDVA